jgi:NAD(P)-dependent dehydrogenase (short-subunit alcohol dehydrogenase family)
MNTLQGKTALGTGASRGIGRATGLAIADAGARVLVHYVMLFPPPAKLVFDSGLARVERPADMTEFICEHVDKPDYAVGTIGSSKAA